MAKNFLTLAFVLLMASCFSRSAMMTYAHFESVQVGSSITSVEEQWGKPYAVHQRKDGTQEYEYIERINAGGTPVAENHYFLIVQDGEVVGKYMSREQSPAYDLIYQEEPNYPNN